MYMISSHAYYYRIYYQMILPSNLDPTPSPDQRGEEIGTIGVTPCSRYVMVASKHPLPLRNNTDGYAYMNIKMCLYLFMCLFSYGCMNIHIKTPCSRYVMVASKHSLPLRNNTDGYVSSIVMVMIVMMIFISITVMIAIITITITCVVCACMCVNMLMIITVPCSRYVMVASKHHLLLRNNTNGYV